VRWRVGRFVVAGLVQGGPPGLPAPLLLGRAERAVLTSFLVRCSRKPLSSPALTRPGLPQSDYCCWGVRVQQRVTFVAAQRAARFKSVRACWPPARGTEGSAVDGAQAQASPSCGRTAGSAPRPAGRRHRVLPWPWLRCTGLRSRWAGSGCRLPSMHVPRIPASSATRCLLAATPACF
jgi:hypothetical protein